MVTALLVGCSTTVPGGKKQTTPTPETVIGKLPTQTLTGDPVKGKVVYNDQSCGACHKFAPAASEGTAGPDLDKLAEHATEADQGTLEEFTTSSVINPEAYIAPGYTAGAMPPTYGQQLTKQQVADLVAFLTKPS